MLQKNTSQYHRSIHSCRISSHQKVVQNTSCCGSQLVEAELYGLVRASAETVGLISIYKDLGTHVSGRRGLGKLRHLDTNYLWIHEKAAKGDLNFKKVAGVDNGADLFTKTLSWNEIQSHIHKLSSQFLQNEVSVNYVGTQPNGVNLPEELQELGIAGGRNLAAWTRTDMRSRTRRTTMKGGPVWSDVVSRVTAAAVNGEVLYSELARDMTRSLEHTPLEGDDLVTFKQSWYLKSRK